MTASLKTRSTEQPAQRQNRVLNLEKLEGRAMMIATHLVLDFTPDYHAGTFWQTFQNSRYSNGQPPAFLDFNGDRRITTQDAEIAAGQIRNAVGSFFVNPARGYNVTVGYNDVLSQTNFGYNYLTQGQRSANDQVLVMYLGGRNTGEIGRAPLAQDGYNVEGYGNTYTQAISTMLMNRSGSTKEMFVWAVANTAAHEFGHMLGLRHSRNVYANDIMNPTQDFTPSNDKFSAVNQYTEGGAAQNAYAELQNSFSGRQRTYFQGVKNGYAQMPELGADHDEHEHEEHEHEDHDHHEDGCDLDIDAVLAGFGGAVGEGFDMLPAESRAESLAALLVPASPAKKGDASPTAKPIRQTSGQAAKMDLLTMLAAGLERTTGSKAGREVTASKSSAVKELDQLFADFGMVTAK